MTGKDTYIEIIIDEKGNMEFKKMPKNITSDEMSSIMESCRNGIKRLQSHGFSSITISQQ